MDCQVPGLLKDGRDPNMVRHWKRTFFVMSVAFSLNHAAVTTPIGYASSLLGSSVGNASNALIYGFCMLSSLFLGPLACGTLGAKAAMLLGMGAYVVYVFCFAAGLLYPAGSPGMSSWALAGSAIAGLGAGSLWTGQGAFYSAICRNLADAMGEDIAKVTNSQSAIFAVWYVGSECLLKALLTLLQIYTDLSNGIVFGLYACIALVSTLVLAFAHDAPSRAPRSSLCASASAAIRLWRDPRIWLLSGSNVAFGFSAAYVSGHVSDTWVPSAFEKVLPGLDGTHLIGLLAASACATAALCCKLFDWLVSRTGSKLPVVAIGAVSFVLTCLLSVVPFGGGGPETWGWGVIVFFLLQGVGRGVYESTNKGIFADFYVGADATGAFANCMMQNTLSSTIGFVLGWVGQDSVMVWLILVSSLFTVPALLVAQTLRPPESAK